MIRSEIISVTGQRGCGKTHWVEHYLDNISRFLIYDTLSEYNVKAPRFRDPGKLVAHIQKHKNSEFLNAIYDPLDDSTFPLFCRIALAVGNVHVLIEELDAFCSPYSAPIEFQRLIKYGRHYGIRLVGISRRPAEVNRLFTSQTNRFVIFRQLEPRDISYWRGIIGKSADLVPKLEERYYLDIDFNDSRTLKDPPHSPIGKGNAHD